MERLNAHMALALSATHDVTILAPHRSLIEESSSMRLWCCPWRGMACFLIWATIVGAIHAVARRPRWIVGGSGLVAPIVLMAGWLSGGRRVVYLHGLDIVVNSRLYQALWLPAIRHMHRCIVNSHNTRDIAVAAGVAPSSIRVVFPGVSLPARPDVFDTRLSNDEFRAKYQLGAGPIILSVGRLTPRKGLTEFIERAMGPLLAASPGVQLIVIGDEAPDALNASGAGQRARVLEAAERAGVSPYVHLIGAVSDDCLRVAFDVANVHVFPGVTVRGDVEGFGMVAIEAAAHGLPTVAFSVGGIRDAVNDDVSGSLVADGDYAELVRRILQWIASSDAVSDAACRRFAERFSWGVFDRSLRESLTAEGI